MARAARSARRGGCSGARSGRCGSSRSPAPAPRSRQAATSRLIERAGAAAALVEVAVGARPGAAGGACPTPSIRSSRLLSTRAANDPDIAQLMAALGPLAHAQRYGDVRVHRCLVDRRRVRRPGRARAGRAAAGVRFARRRGRGADDRAHQQRPAGAGAGRPSGPPARLPGGARSSSPSRPVHGRVHGRATRVLHDSGYWSSGRVEARLGRALSPGTPPAVGADFVEGFLAGSGTVLVHDADLLAVVDRWLSSLTPQAFDETVPLLRRTFGGVRIGRAPPARRAGRRWRRARSPTAFGARRRPRTPAGGARRPSATCSASPYTTDELAT